MNSLGAGGAQSPHLVNAGNALTFCLMVVSCYFSSVMVHYIGIKGALIFGTYVSATCRAIIMVNIPAALAMLHMPQLWSVPTTEHQCSLLTKRSIRTTASAQNGSST